MDSGQEFILACAIRTQQQPATVNRPPSRGGGKRRPHCWQFLPSFPDEVACLLQIGLSFFTFLKVKLILTYELLLADIMGGGCFDSF